MGNVNDKQTMDAITAYNNFLCTYGLIHTEMLPNDAIQDATRMWCSFSPEKQRTYAVRCPFHPSSFGYDMLSEYVRPVEAVGFPIKCAQSRPKKKPKAKTPVAKCRTRKMQTPAASQRRQVGPTKNRITAYKVLKSKAKTLQEPSQTGFQKFFKKLRDKDSAITEKEIVKKAAKAWCIMNQRQRRSFLR